MSNDTQACFPGCFSVDRLISSELISYLPTQGGSGIFAFTLQRDDEASGSTLITNEASEPARITIVEEVSLLPDARLFVKVPIQVRIERDEDGWVCSWEVARLYASGDSAADAKLAFVEYLVDDFHYWNQLSPDQHSEDSQKLLEIYTRHIGRVEK